MRHLFTLFKKKSGNGPVWYARFWNEKAGKYTKARSTGILAEGKKERKREAELKTQGMLSEIRFEMETADSPFVPYLEGFWKPGSPHVKECASLKKTPLSAYYVRLNATNVRLHIKPFPGFDKITLRALTAGLIKDWMSWAVANELSGHTINNPAAESRGCCSHKVLDSGFIPL
jgi:hypothetical protein